MEKGQRMVGSPTVPSDAIAAAPGLAERRRRGRRTYAPYVFIGGAALYLVLLTIAPLLNGLWLSFTDTSLLNPSGGSFIGTKNYDSLLGDPGFYHTLFLTVAYTVGTVVGALGVGTLAAVMLNRSFQGRWFARAVLTMPWAVPTVATALIFTWIFNKDSGILNRTLHVAGLSGHGWLIEPSWALIAVTAATIWKVFPFVMLVLLAALQSVPEEVYEAARVDGADAFSTFKGVVLPYLLPTLRVVGLLITIWSFKRFEIIWLLTQGGPVDSTNTIVIDVYREAFTNSELGTSAAMGVVGLLLSLVATLVYFFVERGAATKEARP
jgi:multiple sugar transport system permease protein